MGASDGDVADAATWSGFPACDVLIHLAARSYVPESWEDPAGFICTNVVGTVNALDHARRHQARVIHLSSYLYGNPTTLPIPETAPLHATNPYALSKQLAEQACVFYADAHGIPIIILRPFNVYGPGQAEHFLIPSIVSQALRGDTIRVKDLGPRRDWIFVGDVVRAIVAATRHPARFSIFNIGSGVSRSVGDLVAAVQSACGTHLPVVSSHERRKDEVMDTVADISRARAGLGWAPAFDLARGIAATCRAAGSCR